jgi:hypothetical protein
MTPAKGLVACPPSKSGIHTFLDHESIKNWRDCSRCGSHIHD